MTASFGRTGTSSAVRPATSMPPIMTPRALLGTPGGTAPSPLRWCWVEACASGSALATPEASRDLAEVVVDDEHVLDRRRGHVVDHEVEGEELAVARVDGPPQRLGRQDQPLVQLVTGGEG